MAIQLGYILGTNGLGLNYHKKFKLTLDRLHSESFFTLYSSLKQRFYNGQKADEYKHIRFRIYVCVYIFFDRKQYRDFKKTVLKSIEKEDPSFTGDGYTSLCIIYGVFALCNWLAPTIIGMIGSRKSIYLGSICYVAFLMPFLWPSNILLYTMSALLGFGASIIWTGQGTYLTMNSDLSTISRNSGIFWAMSKISICIGNVFVILVLCDKTELNESTRMLVFTVLAVVCGFGTLILMTLRPSVDVEDKENEVNFQKPNSMIPKKELKDSMRLLMTKDMLLLSTLFLFTGR
ncbi:hypothetical protein AGLY_000096 [Aphis glycines]|uniref:UNC93-like protein MFSD11 n=1 Tax=Aphis glycines TaxID=307491 RepID=A0A6G0U607_APHGL|nr:hypothetical protein AGLY_000096 [Aphis glycines]